MNDQIRAVCFNANGLNDESKRRSVVESCVKGRVDILGLSETHLKGQGKCACKKGDVGSLWEGMEGGAVWTGLDEECKGRGKEGCAILMSGRVWKCVTDYGRKGTRIVWVKCKIGLVKYAWVSVYAPVNMKTVKGKNEMMKFWNDLNECIKCFEIGRRVIVMGDMNARVGDESVEEVVGKWGVPGRNENGEWLVDVCAERGLFLANTFFQHKMIHRYTWRRGREDEQKGLIDYMAVDKRLRRDVVDAKVVRGMIEGSDHFAVLMKIKTSKKWKFRNERKEESKRLRLEKFREEGVREEYKKRVTEALNVEWGNMDGDANAEEVFEIFKAVVLSVTEGVVGTKVVKVGRKKGNAWWTEEVREVLREKRDAYKKTLERNVPEIVRSERRRKYLECKRRVKQVIDESKKRVDEEFGRQLSEKYKEDKRLYWKEVKNERERETNGSRGGGEVKDVDGMILREKEAVKGRWRTYFENLMNVNRKGETIGTFMGLMRGGGRVHEQEV